MDLNEWRDPSGFWTNEKHVHFLNSMEASFVRTMFEDNGLFLRLDRYLPDTSESTLDLKSQRRRRRKHGNSDVSDPRNRNDRRTDKKTRRHSARLYDPSKDQVVPQLENKRCDDENERDHPDVVPSN